MALQLVEARAVSEQPFERHLEPHDIAAYVDGARGGDARAHIEAHLAVCAECRAEVAEVSRVVASMPRKRLGLRHVWIPAAAAAAIIILVTLPRPHPDPVMQEHREAPVTATVAPRTLAPVGDVDSVLALAWSSVPRAERYHLRLFDSQGTTLWEHETSDTLIALPPAVRVQRGQTYYWKVEAASGFGRRAASDLAEFSVRIGSGL